MQQWLMEGGVKTSSVRISDNAAAEAGRDVAVARKLTPPAISIERFVTADPLQCVSHSALVDLRIDVLILGLPTLGIACAEGTHSTGVCLLINVPVILYASNRLEMLATSTFLLVSHRGFRAKSAHNLPTLPSALRHFWSGTSLHTPSDLSTRE